MVTSREWQPRRRRRLWPIALLLVIVLIVVGAVAAVLHVQSDRRAATRRSQAEAVAVSTAFLRAWSAGDAAAMAGLATPSTAAYVRSEIPALITKLQITSARYTPGAVASKTDPGADFHAAVVLQGLGSWTYNDRLTLEKVDKHWKVDFHSTSIHPGLASGDTLVRQRTLGTRGKLVLADGVALRGRDGELDGNLLGSVGAYTAAQAKAAGPRFLAGDKGGLSGLERSYNATLAGTPGGSLTITNVATGAVVQTLISQPTTNGKNVPLSLDLGVQRAAESALTGVAPGLPGSLVAIDVATGRVLALANHPYNGFGRAIRGEYPPGSTFKVITTTAALMTGKTAATALACTPSVNVGGRTFVNAEGESYGTISLETAFAKSCNTAFVGLSTQLPSGALGAAAALYGFSTKSAAELGTGNGPLPLSSFGGSVPTPVDATDRAAESIGQGRIVASPLQMASVAAAVGSGVWRQPYVSATPPPNNPSHALPAAVVGTLQAFMGDVVTSGTAKNSGLPAGTRGKTGTAEYGSNTPPYTVSWFIGFRSGIAFACQVGGDGTNGGFGADNAAPAVARFLRAIG